MEFITLDVETANADFSSICQIGLVAFRDGVVIADAELLVNPEDDFDEMNIMIHGIDEDRVRDAVTLPVLAPTLKKFFRGNVVVCHTSFDRVAINDAFEKYDMEPPLCRWLDTAKVARRAWPEVAKRGYNLPDLAAKLGITFRHHETMEDARACGEILLRAIEKTGIGLEDWFDRIRQPIDPESKKPMTRAGDPDGHLYGEIVVFTGKLSITRREAADLAARAGCQVAATVNTSTTLVVVGDQELRKLGGHDKSTKHRRAEELAAAGQHIRIVRETDFRRVVDLED